MPGLGSVVILCCHIANGTAQDSLVLPVLQQPGHDHNPCVGELLQVLREEEDAAAAKTVNQAVSKTEIQESLSKVRPAAACIKIAPSHAKFYFQCRRTGAFKGRPCAPAYL